MNRRGFLQGMIGGVIGVFVGKFTSEVDWSPDVGPNAEWEASEPLTTGFESDAPESFSGWVEPSDDYWNPMCLTNEQNELLWSDDGGITWEEAHWTTTNHTHNSDAIGGSLVLENSEWIRLYR